MGKVSENMRRFSVRAGITMINFSMRLRLELTGFNNLLGLGSGLWEYFTAKCGLETGYLNF